MRALGVIIVVLAVFTVVAILTMRWYVAPMLRKRKTRLIEEENERLDDLLNKLK